MILNATFENLAVLAMILAGTGGIAAAAPRSGPGEQARARLVDLLLASLGVVFFAYLPHVLFTGSSQENLSWRAAHGLFAGWHLVVLALSLRGAGVLRSGARGPRSAAILTVPLALAVLVGQVLGALGVVPAYGYFLYLVALLWQLFAAALQFGFLVLANRDSGGV